MNRSHRAILLAAAALIAVAPIQLSPKSVGLS